ncbi:hypothetical protein DXG01_005499 [Tephrocybe rancida]|nr:hypothetical protein DXG01_005499 [Tephrocybe rancida]
MSSFTDALLEPLQRPWPPSAWSLSAGGVTLASAFVLFRLVYYRPGKRVPPPPATDSKANGEVTAEGRKETMSRAMQRVHEAVKPPDGTVRVAEVLIHPIKNDREWCFVDAATHRIITAREFPRVVLIRPRIEADPNDPHGGAIVVAFPPDAPEGCEDFRIPLHPTAEVRKDWAILDQMGLFSEFLDGYIGHSLPLPSPCTTSTPSRASAIASLYFGKPVHLAYKGPRPRVSERTDTFPSLDATTVFQDGYPLLLMSRESMGELEGEIRQRVGVMGVGEEWKDGRVEVRRFRPNVVVEGAGGWAEDAWEELSFGQPDGPAVQLLPNVSPELGTRDKAVPYKVLMKFRIGLDAHEMMKPCVGCNGAFTGSGEVRVGDVVYVRKMVSL